MQRRVLTRLALLVPTILGISIVVFTAVRFLPGDVVDQIAGEFGSGAASAETRERLRDEYSLNDSIASQYLDWVGNALRGDLGTSLVSGRSVLKDIRQRVVISIELGVIALVVSLAISLPIGVLSAVRQDTLVDYVVRSISIGFIAIPSFWLALIVLVYGFRWFNWTPPLHYHQLWEDPVANLKTIWVPALILGATLSGSVMRLTRSTMLEVLRQDYVRTARAKGLREWTVIGRHSVRNALLPVVTVIGLQVPVLIGGTVVLERIFSIPGIGTLLLDSISKRDYPVVQAIVLLTAAAVVISNFLVDVAYSLVDPRIKVS